MQIPAQFDYARADSVEHALELLKQHGPDARIVAGGHSLLPMMRLRLARPDALIDINDLDELAGISRDGDELRVGALTRHAALLDSAEIGSLFPIFHDAERVIADPVVRNRGTIGGSLCQADPAEDLSTVCDVLDARCVIQGADGSRTIPIGEFHRGLFETAVAHGEMLTEVRLPIRAHTSSAYEKVERRAGDWAIAAAGVAVVMDGDTVVDCRIGLTAVGMDGATATRAEDAVRGHALSDEVVAEAARLASEDCEPVADQRGPADYKRHLAGELTSRCLRRAVQRAQATNN